MGYDMGYYGILFDMVLDYMIWYGILCMGYGME